MLVQQLDMFRLAAKLAMMLVGRPRGALLRLAILVVTTWNE